jgi:soluble lytic murein transglycosylase-like protein
MLKRSLVAAALALCVATPAHALDVRSIIADAARAVGVPIPLAQGLVTVETGHRCGLIGRALERGPAQIKPKTARGIGYRGPDSGLSDCRTGALWGMRYLRLALDRSHGNWMAAATRYNAGLGTRRTSSEYGRKVIVASRR